MSEITLALEHPSLGCGEIIARYDLSEIQEKAYQQGRAEAFEEVYNLIDEGVCDMCERQNFDGDCFKTCQEEITIVKNWVKKKFEKTEISDHDKLIKSQAIDELINLIDSTWQDEDFENWIGFIHKKANQVKEKNERE